MSPPSPILWARTLLPSGGFLKQSLTTVLSPRFPNCVPSHPRVLQKIHRGTLGYFYVVEGNTLMGNTGSTLYALPVKGNPQFQHKVA